MVTLMSIGLPHGHSCPRWDRNHQPVGGFGRVVGAGSIA